MNEFPVPSLTKCIITEKLVRQNRLKADADPLQLLMWNVKQE